MAGQQRAANQRTVLGALAWAAGGEKAAYPRMLPKQPEPEPVPLAPLRIVD
ncbi:hypothetical protein ACF068_07520 [Streptomyces sp. NPDC016309]|uniref:hypothetical protein n=1 Tax=Streptomyces sp. NPDC016309 TaxID=3364965 RepID=UPI0036FD315B